MRVSRAYKGAVKAGERVVVRREGGSVDGIGMRVYGAASFTVGEEVAGVHRDSAATRRGWWA